MEHVTENESTMQGGEDNCPAGTGSAGMRSSTGEGQTPTRSELWDLLQGQNRRMEAQAVRIAELEAALKATVVTTSTSNPVTGPEVPNQTVPGQSMSRATLLKLAAAGTAAIVGTAVAGTLEPPTALAYSEADGTTFVAEGYGGAGGGVGFRTATSQGANGGTDTANYTYGMQALGAGAGVIGAVGSVPTVTGGPFGVYGDGGSGTGVYGHSSAGDAIQGYSDSTGAGGVAGFSTSSSGHGAYGQGATGVWGSSSASGSGGIGVRGDGGASGYGARLYGGLAPILLIPSSSTGHPTSGTHQQGELVVDASGNMFICTLGGTYATGQAAPQWAQFATSSTPTVARITSLAARRRGDQVELRWRMADTVGIAGFDVYGGEHRLNRRRIVPHRSRSYTYRTRWTDRGRLSLRVIMVDGREVTVQA